MAFVVLKYFSLLIMYPSINKEMQPMVQREALDGQALGKVALVHTHKTSNTKSATTSYQLSWQCLMFLLDK